MFTNLLDYEDEDMVMMKQFVANIPFMRKLPLSIVNQVIMIMNPYFFAFGDVILTQDSYNDNIMLVLEGTV